MRQVARWRDEMAVPNASVWREPWGVYLRTWAWRFTVGPLFKWRIARARPWYRPYLSLGFQPDPEKRMRAHFAAWKSRGTHVCVRAGGIHLYLGVKNR